jgi:3-isopropylmalate/(R)-2-methylmalate dehydratase large subunit
MGMTIAEKILAAHAGKRDVKPGEYVWAKVDATSGHALPALEAMGVEAVWNPDKVFLVEDHQAPPPTIEVANRVRELRRLVKKYRIKNFFEFGRHGILHQLFAENGMFAPGDLVAMADSHSTSGGVFNACVTNANLDSAYVLAFGELWFRVPESVKVVLNGRLPDWCVGKDVILKIAGELGTPRSFFKPVLPRPATPEMPGDAIISDSIVHVHTARSRSMPCCEPILQASAGCWRHRYRRVREVARRRRGGRGCPRGISRLAIRRGRH